jgi:hypothetical protein
MVTVDDLLVTMGKKLVAAENIMVTISNKLGNRWKQGKDL